MSIILLGLNYRTAPVELREKLALSGCALRMALEDLRSAADSANQPISEGVILSTCNRLEIYASAHHAESGLLALQAFLCRLQNISPAELTPHLYQQTDEDATRHLMRVACGLDSMIMGEPQILGQVTQAFEDAHAAGMTGPILSHLFTQAIHTGKRARTETDISRYTTSVSHAGALLVTDKLARTRQNRILIIGAGEMAVLAAQALNRFDGLEIAFVNRTYSRAESLAQEMGGTALNWYELENAIVWADAIICATGAPHIVLYKRDVEASLAHRAGRPLLIVDIAVPRDVEHTVGELAGVDCCDIDDLQSVVDANLELRKAAVPHVETIITDEIARFTEWYHSRRVTPVIKTLRDWAQEVAAHEVEQALNRLHGSDEHTQQVIQRMAHRLVNRLLHEPTARLRVHAAEGNGYGYAHAVCELFGLNEIDPCQQEESRCGVNEASTACNLQCIITPDKN